jgi:hypothetical protein
MDWGNRRRASEGTFSDVHDVFDGCIGRCLCKQPDGYTESENRKVQNGQEFLDQQTNRELHFHEAPVDLNLCLVVKLYRPPRRIPETDESRSSQ